MKSNKKEASDKNDLRPKNVNRLIWFFAIASGLSGLIVLIVFSILLALNYNLNGKILPEETGITGDFIGGVVGTLWSLTSVLLFYQALRIQREDLKHQRVSIDNQTVELKNQAETLELQRQAMIESRKVAEQQGETMKLQKFENTFFNFISNHVQLMDTIPQQNAPQKLTLRRYNALKHIKDQFCNSLKLLNSTMNSRKIDVHSNYVNGLPENLIKFIQDYHPLAEDTILLLQFIQHSRIENTNFYHQILYNSMSLAERYLFGFYLEFKDGDNGFGDEVKKMFQIEYFNDKEHSISKTTKLPPKISIIDPKNFSTQITNLKRELNNLEFTVCNFEKSNLTIKSVKAQVSNGKTIQADTNVELLGGNQQPLRPFDVDELNLKPRFSNHTIYDTILTFSVEIEFGDSGIYTLASPSVVFHFEREKKDSIRVGFNR